MKSFFKKIVITLLAWEARMVLRRKKPKIVAITGSVGKTSTKDAIYTVLSTAYFTRKSEKSFNSEFGVPLTILGLHTAWADPFLWISNLAKGFWLIFSKKPYPEWLVLEVGADKPGDIQSLTRWLKSDVVVMTRIGSAPVHIEFFKNREQLIEEKSYLARALKSGGTLVLNADDADILAMKQYAKGKVITISYDATGEGKKEADLVASHDSVFYEKNKAGEELLSGITFKVNFEGNSVPVVRKGVLGIQHIFPTLSALAVGISQGLNIVTLYNALSESDSAPGRMRLIAGIKGSFIIDDTYNSSPVALEAALGALKNVKVKGKKIAVLGDMMELGKHSTEEHEKAGLEVAKVVDKLVTVGVRSRSIASGALGGGLADADIMQFDTAAEAGEFVATKIKEGDIVLFKGSQSTRMEKAVVQVMADPDQRGELLVRQDAEWQVR